MKLATLSLLGIVNAAADPIPTGTEKYKPGELDPWTTWIDGPRFDM